MIVIVQNTDKKRLLVKTLSVVSLITMFWLYYGHMSDRFQEQNTKLLTKIEKHEEKNKKINSKAIKLEKTIYKEAVVIVNLIEQKHVQSIKIVKDKLLIVCDFNTNIEPLLIRYGVNAMVKSTEKNLKLALDLRTIVENKYES